MSSQDSPLVQSNMKITYSSFPPISLLIFQWCALIMSSSYTIFLNKTKYDDEETMARWTPFRGLLCLIYPGFCASIVCGGKQTSLSLLDSRGRV